MGKNRTYWRYSPVSTYDIPGMETWLEDMAGKGFFLEGFTLGFGNFKKSTPKQVRYRLELVGKDKDYPEPDSRLLYKDSGWNYITTFAKQFHIYMTEDSTAPELHTDPVIQSYTLDKLNRNSIVFR